MNLLKSLFGSTKPPVAAKSPFAVVVLSESGTKLHLTNSIRMAESLDLALAEVKSEHFKANPDDSLLITSCLPIKLSHAHPDQQ